MTDLRSHSLNTFQVSRTNYSFEFNIYQSIHKTIWKICVTHWRSAIQSRGSQINILLEMIISDKRLELMYFLIVFTF